MPRVTFNTRDLESAGYEATVKAKQRNAIKKEIEYPGEQQQQVFHRKSERRRVARDIFLVFEEQPSSRRGVRGSNKKKTPPKSKFGHLKVEDPNKNKSLLRDIKNEPKCYLSSCPVSKSQKVPNAATNVFKSAPQVPSPSADTTGDNPTARVNPIFLWVKQDDTRIVEVRCEDYDKRNRIRLTKTTNGWRAIPRTDPSSSRIVKFFQTPLLKVKRELYEKRLIENTDDDTSSVQLDSDGFDTAFINGNEDGEAALVEQQPAIQKEKQVRRKSKKVKTKCKKASISITDCNETVVVDIDNTLETSEEPFENVGKVQEEPITDYDEDSQVSTNANYGEYEYDGKDNDLSETYHKHTPVAEMQLCPITGLFLPNTNADNVDNNFSCVPLPKDIMVDLVSCHIECTKTQADDIIENIDDSDTKNLKDLLDDADLLQHCGDNANSDAELIDSLVKRSCENNLIQEAEVHKDSSVSLNTFATASSGNDLTQKDSVLEDIPQIINTVSDSPKCLSFNEAGEIEGLNGELFQSHSYIDTFDKVPVEEISQLDSTKLSDTIDVPMIQSAIIDNKLISDGIVENNIPKDLSYKKREEVCPQSESRSQCAVTSSSDVIKSPTQNAIPAIDSTSEAIKTLILEQFIKLNALNTMPNSVGKQQSEPIDLGKHREKDIDTAANESSQPTTNYIETVVIDDNSDDEPVKKRQRSSVNSANLTDSSSIIDKDPDPLTQLQLLIRNTQWKVPDPILVPKDRLSAVLASPAREIPLLITTRPELRLPEAFAFPEIIQNPNILVISMAQLEAILKNEMEMEKGKTQRSIGEFSDENIRKLNQQNINEIHNEPKTLPPKESSTKCSHAESSLASDINAATLAVLNQMLWLPYFGQLSQEFLQSLKDPMGIQNKYTNLLPLLNPQFGLQHLDELYKNYIKQLSTLKHMNSESSSNQTPNFSNVMSTFQSPVELAIFQKMMQHQMHNILRLNPLSTDASQRETMTKNASTQEQSSNAANISSAEQKKHRRSLTDNALSSTYVLPDHNSNNERTGKSMCLKNIKSNCDNLLDNAEFNNKPRLTCKSLSNLLEPESMNTPAVPLVNLTSDNIKNTQEFSKQIDNKIISKDTCVQPSEPNSLITARHNKVNPIANSQELSKQRKRNINYIEPSITELSARNPETTNSDSNTALWHPLFGNNSKTGYSSPWQWTTVTATGE